MKTSQLQSLSNRIGAAIASVHLDIAYQAAMLTKIEEVDRPIYAELSKLQRERKKLEDLQHGIKKDLRAAIREENALRLLDRHGFNINGILVIDERGQNFIEV